MSTPNELSLDHVRRLQLQARLAQAVILLLQEWVDSVGFGEMPESFTAEVLEVTGYMGGDSGHGGELAVRFGVESGDNHFICEPESDLGPGGSADASEQEGAVTLVARGDWEQGGLVCTLARLLIELLPVYSPMPK